MKFASALASRLPANLDIRVSAPHIHDEAYWRRAAIEGHGWSAEEVSSHGQSWKQLYIEKEAARLLENFGLYLDLPPGYEEEFCRPPIDSTNQRWGTLYPKTRAEIAPTGDPTRSGTVPMRWMRTVRSGGLPSDEFCYRSLPFPLPFPAPKQRLTRASSMGRTRGGRCSRPSRPQCARRRPPTQPPTRGPRSIARPTRVPRPTQRRWPACRACSAPAAPRRRSSGRLWRP